MRPYLSLAGLGLVLVFCLTAPLGQAAAAAGDPSKFMSDLGAQVLHLISDKQLPETERKQRFNQLADQSFDVPQIARFVLGRYWHTSDDGQRQEFTTAFETYMVDVYWSRFAAYAGEDFKVTGQRDGGDNILVYSEIARPNGQEPAKVIWQLEKSGDSFKIIDVSLESVSQRSTYRDEFASVIQRNGGDVAALINDLRQKTHG